jgi:hypothetical protein
MVPCVSKNGSDEKCGTLLPSELQQVPEEWLMYPKQVIITTHICQDVMGNVWVIMWLVVVVVVVVYIRQQESKYI